MTTNQPPTSKAKSYFWVILIALIIVFGLFPQVGGAVIAGSALFIVAIPLIMVCGFLYFMYQAFFGPKGQ